MSKTLQARIRCPNCKNQFEATLYRSIWIEFPENRKLIFDDNINRVTCPACKMQTKLEFPFLCTNVKEHIAVWYEPYPDADVEKDAQLYARHHGPSSFYATAPRIRDWNAFKEKIVELEERTGVKLPSRLSPEMQEKMQGFMNHLKDNQAKKQQEKAKSRVGSAVGIFSSVINAVRGDKAKREMTVAHAEVVVTAYGAILESGPVPGTVADDSELPFPKETIKQALLLLLRTRSDPKLREHLKSGFILLADWQSGVGPVRLGVDFTKIDLTQDAMVLAKRHKADAEAAEKWLAVAKAEQEALVTELQALGLW